MKTIITYVILLAISFLSLKYNHHIVGYCILSIFLLFQIISFFIRLDNLADIETKNSRDKGKIESDITRFGFDIFPFKTIHSEYGKFYLIIESDNKVCIYKSTFLFFKSIAEFIVYTDVDDLKSKINRKIESSIGEKVRIERMEKDRRKKVKNEIYKWDGCLTTQISRDKKIDKII